MRRFLLLSLLISTGIGASGLDPAQSAALAEARERYAVRVFAHPAGAVVVLLGESHVKFRKSHVLGRKALAEFPARGLESEDGADMSAGMRSQEKVTGALYETLNRITGGRGPYGSLLTDALDAPVTPGRGELAVIPLERLHEGDRVHPFTYLFYAEISLFQVALPLMFVKAFGVARWASRYQEFVSIPLFVTGAVGYFFGRPLEQATLAEKIVLHVFYGAVERRNALMAQNLARARDEYPGHPVLAIMGAAHLRGVAESLVRSHGYRELEPPARHRPVPARLRKGTGHPIF